MKHIKKFENLSYDFLGKKLLDSIKSCNFDDFIDCINKGADVNFYLYSRDTFPLLQTVGLEVQSKEFKQIRYEMVKILIEKGADVNKTDSDGFTPLLLAAEPEPFFNIVELLIESDADWMSVDSNDWDFIEILLKSHHDDFVKDIIKKYPDKYKNYRIKKDAKKYNL